MAQIAPLRVLVRVESLDLPYGLSSRNPTHAHFAETCDLIVGHYERGASPEDLADDYALDLTFVEAVLAYWPGEATA